jgi:hypothetical protein
MQMHENPFSRKSKVDNKWGVKPDPILLIEMIIGFLNCGNVNQLEKKIPT